ncbi:hypothetical protein AGR5A_Cc10024 [Agrobacterium genomosp. 5 str. CFBP 6626]|nr:hypothetical protein AGR5A_Cc10024 [Agrobacterium genomosp. 5 str. CFBP 6626]
MRTWLEIMFPRRWTPHGIVLLIVLLRRHQMTAEISAAYNRLNQLRRKNDVRVFGVPRELDDLAAERVSVVVRFTFAAILKHVAFVGRELGSVENTGTVFNPVSSYPCHLLILSG